jgi:hypothetical protein
MAKHKTTEKPETKKVTSKKPTKPETKLGKFSKEVKKLASL